MASVAKYTDVRTLFDAANAEEDRLAAEHKLPRVSALFAARKDSICDLCGQPTFELRPFGPNHESICEECSLKDPEMTEQRWRELGNG